MTLTARDRAARAEHVYALSRDALAAGIRLVNTDPGDNFDTWQLTEYKALVALAAWANAMLDPNAGVPPEPTPLHVQHRPLPAGVPVVDIDNPDTYPEGFREV